MDGLLPMSFGGPRAVGRPRSKKRKRADNTSTPAVESLEAEADGQTPMKETALVEKVHVTFDSDGEVAARKVEHVEVEVQTPAETVSPAESIQETVVVAAKVAKQSAEPPGTADKHGRSYAMLRCR